MINFGVVRPGRTLYIPFHTFSSDDPSASMTITGLAVGDIKIYKNGSVTERASTSGFTLLDTDGIDFDGITGIHGVSIDLANNTTAGFYSAGAQYTVVISTITLDGATISFIAALFSIGYPNATINTTIATLSTQTSFTLTDGPAENNALNGMWCIIHDVASSVQLGRALISGYTGATKTVTLAAATTFTVAATDNISIMDIAPLQPVTVGRQLIVDANSRAEVLLGAVTHTGAVVPTVSTLTGHTVQTGDSFARIGATGSGLTSLAQASVCTEGRLSELDAANLPAVTDGIQTDLDNGTDGLGALKTLIDALNDVSTTDILTQVNAALDTAISELGVAAPTATPTLRTGLMLLYMSLRNKVDITATTKEIHNDAGTKICEKALSDDGTTYTEGELA